MSYFSVGLRALAVTSLYTSAAWLPAAPPTESPSQLPALAQEQQLIVAALRAEVHHQLAAAKQSTDPAATLGELKLTAERIARAAELDASSRAELRVLLEAAMRDTSRRAEAAAQQAAVVQARSAAARDRDRALEQLATRQERLDQLLDRFSALLSESRYDLAQSVADEVQLAASGSPAAASAGEHARLARAEREGRRVREARQHGLVASLASTDTSAVPQPDDQPIVHPGAAVWEELTHRRVKYAPVDRQTRQPAEIRIDKALKETTSLSFIATPLQDVVDYLKDLHQIEIQIDVRALADGGMDTQSPVDIQLEGVSLRSALRLMLSRMDLAYIIKDEVLLITTPEIAVHHIVTRVYPVDQLVSPIQQTGFEGGFGDIGNFGKGMFGQNGGGGQQQQRGMNNNMPLPFGNGFFNQQPN